MTNIVLIAATTVTLSTLGVFYAEWLSSWGRWDEAQSVTLAVRIMNGVALVAYVSWLVWGKG